MDWTVPPTKEILMTTGRVLALVTNAADYQKVGYRTGLWLGELTHFQDCLLYTSPSPRD